MKLRKWQVDCIDQALSSYAEGNKNYFVMATPAGGKTTMASNLSARLIDSGAIDLVICFAPTIAVASGFREELEAQVSDSFDGSLGAKGQVLTYQALSHLNSRFWALFDRLKVLVIFDEIHHCGGDQSESSTAWGQIISKQIQARATYILSLSGTPWRSDKLPVTLASYCSQSSKLKPDYIYGIQSAIDDAVCRIPRITAIDNDNISLKVGSISRSYLSIESLLNEENLPYQKLLDSESFIRYVLQQAIFRLCMVRYSNPNAAGLLVASTVNHAHFLFQIMTNYFKEDCVIITHQDPTAQENLERFKLGTTKWVVSVGMISEGTNIPRLQVCCHLSNIKTELHFRQVLGRIMRITPDDRHPYAYLYILAEKNLVDFARRLSDDLPKESCVLEIEHPSSLLSEKLELQYSPQNIGDLADLNDRLSLDIEAQSIFATKQTYTEYPSGKDAPIELSIFGRYLKQLLEIENLKGAF
jgi:superfamily II DNA or RNA helicase